jgi:hypothetical protein
MNLRILSALALALTLTACPDRVVSTDFVLLVDRAYPPGKDPRPQALDDLWKSLFRLPRWYFLMTPESAAKKEPAVVVLDDQGWLMAFTDPEKASRYARAKSHISDAGTWYLSEAPDGGTGTPLALDLTPAQALAMLQANTDPAVTGGIRFNEGAMRGWFAPLKSVSDIHDYLKTTGKLDPPKK